MKDQAKMNYYTSTAPKCAYRLRGMDLSINSSRFVAECCHFHGCQGHDFRTDSDFCHLQYKNEAWRVNGKGKPWKSAIDIFHYSRSLEKFALKGKTWTTSSGEVRPGETAEQAARAYDIPKFLHRNVGWMQDSTALRYSCQVRQVLEKMTREKYFLRAGEFWMRNVEFGKDVSDPDKRGRYGRPNPKAYKYNDQNPYHYHGNGYVGPVKNNG